MTLGALPRVCAWCVRDGRAEDVPGASHSLCAACRVRYFPTVTAKVAARDPHEGCQRPDFCCATEPGVTPCS